MSDPKELLYSKGHSWVLIEGTKALIGITDYAQDALGDVTYVDCPSVDDEISAGDAMGSVESVKAASDIISPINGRVTEVNAALEDAPESVNQDPYGAGWICRADLSSAPEGLLSADEYAEFCKNEGH